MAVRKFALKGAQMRSFRVYSLLLILTGLVDLPACGSYFSGCHMCPPPPKPQNFVYTANAGGNQSTVSALSASPSTGQLTPLAGSPYKTGSGSIALTSDPVRGRLYVANSGSGNISGFTIDLKSGALSPVASSPFPAESGMDSLAITPDGGFVYGVTGNSANLWGYSVDSGGALTPTGLLPTLIAASATNSSSVAIDPSGKYVYTATGNSVSTNIYGFSRDTATGVLSPLSGFPLPVAGLANKTVFDPSGKFWLVTGTNEFGTMGGIEVFSLNASTGALSLVTGPVQVGNDPAAVAVDASGKYVYVPNTSDATISAFTLDSNSGALSPVTGSPFPSGGNGNVNGPLGIVASVSFVYACNASNDISAFSINPSTGLLTAVAGSPFPDGGNAPTAIVVVP
jgi:6-phosphogluconolactonase